MNPIPTLEATARPNSFRDESHLEGYLFTPTRGLVADLAGLYGDITVLRVCGKVGPILAMMAKRAAPGKMQFVAGCHFLFAEDRFLRVFARLVHRPASQEVPRAQPSTTHWETTGKIVQKKTCKEQFLHNTLPL